MSAIGADMDNALRNVRFWGLSGRGADLSAWPLLTRSDVCVAPERTHGLNPRLSHVSPRRSCYRFRLGPRAFDDSARPA